MLAEINLICDTKPSRVARQNSPRCGRLAEPHGKICESSWRSAESWRVAGENLPTVVLPRRRAWQTASKPVVQNSFYQAICCRRLLHSRTRPHYALRRYTPMGRRRHSDDVSGAVRRRGLSNFSKYDLCFLGVGLVDRRDLAT